MSSTALQNHLKNSGYKIQAIDPNNADKYDSSIPLILPNDYEYDLKTKSIIKKADVQRTSLYLVPEALELLSSVTSPLAILSICGPMRTGKSYILSRLLGEVDAFDLGHTFDPKTFGIWMGTKILVGKDQNGKEQAVLLLDTEGIDAPGTSVSQDAGILVLTILISSILIYNSQNVPYKKDLEKLDCFIRLAEGFKVKNDHEIEVAEISQYFPHFIWLLRDVSLTISDGEGGEMEPTNYIKKKVLSRSTKYNADKSDEVGRAIITFFPDIECITLPLPHGDEKIMQKIAQHTNDLNPKFQKGVQDFMAHLIAKVQTDGAKHGYQKGSVITGTLLCGLLKEYLIAVNDPNAIPCLDNAWKNTVDLLRTKTMEELIKKYKTAMTEKIQAASVRGGKTYPLEEDGGDQQRSVTLMGLHDQILKAITKELLGKVAHFGAGDIKDLKKNSEELVKIFQKKIIEVRKKKGFTMGAHGNRMEYEGMDVCGGELLEFIRKNRFLSTEYCTKLYQELFAPIQAKVEHEIETYTFKQLEADFRKLNEEYLRRAVGPEKWNVLSEMDKKTREAQISNFKKVKGYQGKVMKERQRAKEAENEARQRNEEVKKLYQEAMREKEKEVENVKNMQMNFQNQMDKLREEERKRREEETKKLQDLQKSNFAEFREMFTQFNESENKRVETMLESFKLEQEQSRQQRAKEVEIEATQRKEELEKFYQEANREREKNTEKMMNMQTDFQNQTEKLREEERKRRKEEMEKLQDFQEANFADFQEMIKSREEERKRREEDEKRWEEEGKRWVEGEKELQNLHKAGQNMCKQITESQSNLKTMSEQITESQSNLKTMSEQITDGQSNMKTMREDSERKQEEYEQKISNLEKRSRCSVM